MRPLIGLSGSRDVRQDRLWVSRDYIQAIETAGGIPLLLDYGGIAYAKDLLQLLDGILLTGGGDVDPLFFHEEPIPGCGEMDPVRDAFEIQLVKDCLDADIPLLGICRGIQVINIAAGGDIYQDIYTQTGNAIKHSQEAARNIPSHTIEILVKTRLAEMIGQGSMRVNSFHHQAVRNLAPGFVVAARAKDGLVEAIEGKDFSFILGVQWHPETMWQKNDKAMQLFHSFVHACGKKKDEQ